jgi:hypothetical protein
MRGMIALGGPPRPGWLRELCTGPGIALAFLWGFAEGTFFFVVPDVLLSLVAAYQPRRAWRHVLAAVAGATLAGGVMYAWAANSPAQARAAVARVPFVREAMFQRVRGHFERHGARGLFIGPVLGIPYKIYAVEAQPHVAPASFVVWSIPARAIRFVLVWLISAIAGFVLLKLMPRRVLLPTAVHAVLWTAFYAYYWTTI